MKINSIGPSDAISNYKSNLNSTPVKGKLEANVSDSVELSEGAQKFSALLKAAKESLAQSDENEDVKAADILAQMKAGTYEVPDDAVVQGILGGGPSEHD